jgi:hypothetical protein
MLTVKTSEQLRTMRHVKSYRSCSTSTGLPMWGAELGRICQGMVARANHELRRRWLDFAWRHHCRRGR